MIGSDLICPVIAFPDTQHRIRFRVASKKVIFFGSTSEKITRRRRQASRKYIKADLHKATSIIKDQPELLRLLGTEPPLV